MDYKKEIENFMNEIQSEKFLKFLYNVIVSFKRQLEEAKEEADNLENDWDFCSQQRLILAMQTDIINFTLKIFDYKCLSMALSYVKAAYNQQPPEEEEEQEDEE